MIAETVTQPKPARLIQGWPFFALIGSLMLTLLLEALDQTIVGTAMPRIIRELQGMDRYTWVVTIYLLAATTAIPIVGKLSDQFGRKPFLVGGVVVFLVGSVLCGAAQTIEQLIAFRALQGLGGGIGISLVFTVIGDIFPSAERGRWSGIVGMVYTVSSVFGPTFGGWMADNGPLVWPVLSDSSRWRWVFYINVPVGLIGLAGLLLYLPGNIPLRSAENVRAAGRIDVGGALLALGATVSLFLGFTWVGDGAYEWASLPVIGALALAALLYALLIAVELRAAEPIIPLDLFRNRVFAANALLSLFQLMALLGMAFYLPLYIQNVLGASATQSGATMTPFSLSIPIGGFLAGLAISAMKRYQLIAIGGAIAMSVGIFLLNLLTPDTTLLYVTIAVAVAGFGMGVLNPVIGVVSLNGLPPTRLGAASGAIRYLGQIGGTVGVAAVGTVVNGSLSAGLALADAIGRGLILVLIFCVAAVLATLFLRDLPMVDAE